MELYERLEELYGKAYIGKDFSVDEMQELLNIMLILDKSGDYTIYDRYPIVGKLKDGISRIQDDKMMQVVKSCEEHYSELNSKVLEIFKSGFDNSKFVRLYDPIITKEEAIKQAKEFYKGIGQYEGTLINKIINDKCVYISNDPDYQFYTPDGCCVLLNGENNIFIKYNSDSELLTSYITSALVHELGHAISTENVSSFNVIYNPFRELLSFTFQEAFEKTRKKHLDEYAKTRYERLITLRKTSLGIYTGNELKWVFEDYLYSIGTYFGLYLSQLYMADRKKFKYLYSEIKKYIYTDNESRIFDLLLQGKEIKTGEFLKREIEETQKILTR